MADPVCTNAKIRKKKIPVFIISIIIYIFAFRSSSGLSAQKPKILSAAAKPCRNR